MRAGARLVCKKVCVNGSNKEFKEPYWKLRIEDNIPRVWKDLSQIEDWFKGRWNNIKHRRKDELKRKYRIKAKGFKIVTEELKQRTTLKAGKLKRYKARVNQYRQNILFRCNEKALYEDLDGKRRESSDPPQAGNNRKFWSEIWDKLVQYKEDVEWLVKDEKELEVVKTQNNVVKTRRM